MQNTPQRATLAALVAGAAVLGSCRNTLVDLGPRTKDVFADLDRTPLLIDLPDVTGERKPRVAEAERILITDGEPYELLEFRGTQLVEAVALIAELAQASIVVDPSLSGTVTATFRNVSLDDALHTLLARHQMRLAKGEGAVLWVESLHGSQNAVGEFQLGSIAAADIAENLEQIVGPGGQIVVDVQHDFVFVRGTQAEVDAVGRYLDGVDRIRNQVLVEVHLFEVNFEDSFEVGVSLDHQGIANGEALDILSSFTTPGNNFSLTLQDDDLTATVEALRRYVGLELVSSPKVVAISNTESTVEVIREIPYVNVTTVTSGTTGGVGATTQEAVEFREAGVKLTVTPTVQADDMVQLQISQELSEVAEFFNDIPVLDTRSLTSSFLVQDGNTVVMGGLAQTRHTETDAGIPLLMHIPIVGHLFKSDEDARQKRNLLVFVTPRVLHPEQAAQLAPYFREGYLDARADLDPPSMVSIDEEQDAAYAEGQASQGE